MSDSFVPPRIDTFRVSQESVDALATRGIETFFPIQAATYDHIFDKKDVIGRARTGQGKTISFALPLCERFLASGKFKGKHGRAPLVLVLLPTRELCIQVYEEIEKICVGRWNNLAVYGGADIVPQMKALRAGVDMVVGTPGRVIDLITKSGALSLAKIRAFVLDEADQMLENDFKENVEEILSNLREQKARDADEDNRDGVKGVQFLMFSATLPEWVNGLANTYMSADRIKIDVAKNEKQHAAPTVRHLAMQVAVNQRQQALADVMTMYAGLHGRTIIFTATKQQCNDIALNSEIKQFSQALHGDIPQNQREQTMKAFKEGKFRCLVATDVAARGLHVDNIELVVQMFPPSDAETYIHRSGRTGRANKKGVCLTFASKNDLRFLETIERLGKFKFERVGVPQAEQLLESTADTIIDGLTEVKEEVADKFTDAATRLLTRFEGDYERALRFCLCELTGYSDPNKLVARSALTGREGFKAFHLILQGERREVRSPSYIWSVLKNLEIENVDAMVTALQLTEDGRGACFDVAPEGLDEFLGSVEKLDERCKTTYFDVVAVSELPKLKERNGGAGDYVDERALARGKNPNSASFRARSGNFRSGGGGEGGQKRSFSRGPDRDFGNKRGRYD